MFMVVLAAIGPRWSLSWMSELRTSTGLEARSILGHVEGVVDAKAIEPSCEGFISAEPQLTVWLREPTRVGFALHEHTDARSCC